MISTELYQQSDIKVTGRYPEITQTLPEKYRKRTGRVIKKNQERAAIFKTICFFK